MSAWVCDDGALRDAEARLLCPRRSCLTCVVCCACFVAPACLPACMGVGVDGARYAATAGAILAAASSSGCWLQILRPSGRGEQAWQRTHRAVTLAGGPVSLAFSPDGGGYLALAAGAVLGRQILLGGGGEDSWDSRLLHVIPMS